ncbi:DUF3526 domain-containing protein [Agaribacterium sp. ZY112]|uniref:DUF3526 domain-containing protein n=1 Tax=Agaribacterium sp. ZY112 TaxID=3233574 RepID=UPI003525FDB9
MTSLFNEIRFAAKDRTLCLWMVIVISLSTVALGFGLAEVQSQNATIAALIESDREDRLAESAKLKDWGSAAYYNFHLTYDEPSTLAFMALGGRDIHPWKHRIRMLALEGQIYERDVGNPSVALIGRFDFSFLASFVLPLVLIIVLYDLRAGEQRAGRFNLLEATAIRPVVLWGLRVWVRATAVFLCLIIPLFVGGLVAGASLTSLLTVAAVVFLYSAFWSFLCFKLSAWRQSAPIILMALTAIWLLTAVAIPAAARLAVDRLVPIPDGADILMLQRESVNDAWDLPREATMDKFFQRYPEYVSYEPVSSSFEWQWYYAFQQVGDQEAESLSKAYRQGRVQRDNIAAWLSLLAPPSLLERTLQSLAGTDMKASNTYEQQVRDYHAQLRAFYYPKFFFHETFDKNSLQKLPVFGGSPLGLD